MAEHQEALATNPVKEFTLRPALRQIGITPCPICRGKISALLTKINRPFVNSSFCSARIFYSGRESRRQLKRKMTGVPE